MLTGSTVLGNAFAGSFIGSHRVSEFTNQIRTVNFMTLVRLARDNNAEETFMCLQPECNNANEATEERKAKLVETLITVFVADPGAIIPNVCNCENLVEAVCCNARYAEVAEEYYGPTHEDEYFI